MNIHVSSNNHVRWSHSNDFSMNSRSRRRAWMVVAFFLSLFTNDVFALSKRQLAFHGSSFDNDDFYSFPVLSFSRQNRAGIYTRAVFSLRGGEAKPTISSTNKLKGATSTSPTKTKKKKKKLSRSSKSATSSSKAATRKPRKKTTEKEGSTSTSVDSLKAKKQKIEEVLKADPSKVLGDAIRDRADQLLSSPMEYDNSLLNQIDQTVTSVGWAMGASDRLASLVQNSTVKQDTDALEEETGGVEVATTAVLVHYFLKSHGGAHAVQCVCSLLASLTGLGAILLPLVSIQKAKNNDGTSPISELTLVLIRRCLTFAMMKHVSGMLAASVMAARAIPELGLRKARVWIQQLSRDPVSQYVFYTACVLFWLPSTISSRPLWWKSYAMVPFVLVGPVVLREFINIVYVFSDVMILWLCSNQNDSSKTAASDAVRKILRLSQAAINAFMSVIVSAQVWRSADAMKRQAILAKLTGRLSLVLELVVGLLISADAAMLSLLTLYKPSERPPVASVFKTLVCAQLYLQFLWVRRRKISKIATQVRGGAADFPLYVLDVLLDPVAAMGLKDSEKKKGSESTSSKKESTWKDYVLMAFGLDDR